MNNPIYLIVGFGMTWGVLVWYAWRVSQRIRSATSDLAGHGGGSGRQPAS